MSEYIERVARGRRFRFFPSEWLPAPTLLKEFTRPMTEADGDLPIHYIIGVDTAYEALSVMLNGHTRRAAEAGEHDVVQSMLYYESSGGYASSKPHHLISVIFEGGATSPVPPPHFTNMVPETDVGTIEVPWRPSGYLKLPAAFWQNRNLSTFVDPTYTTGFLLETPFNRRVHGKEGADLWLRQRLEGVK